DDEDRVQLVVDDKHRAVLRGEPHLGPTLQKFIVGSTDRTRRSGVGNCESGAVRFAISEDGVNLHDFARLFRDHLKCPDALFLEGGRGVGL
ncbi:phosphodiester glycosidase family protein, partial [Rhizobium leguminosarum]|uniref:phosphodiester glycosidase family protein n=1 Tax=Rhizobium leguminosarum TaxID=384 RepID=UPI003F9EB190